MSDVGTKIPWFTLPVWEIDVFSRLEIRLLPGVEDDAGALRDKSRDTDHLYHTTQNTHPSVVVEAPDDESPVVLDKHDAVHRVLGLGEASNLKWIEEL